MVETHRTIRARNRLILGGKAVAGGAGDVEGDEYDGGNNEFLLF